MSESIYDKVIQALIQAENHNSHVMVTPEAILWPDPENQWMEVIAVLQQKLPQLLVYGSYDPSRKQGPAIWLKCMVAKMLPEANWDDQEIPIIYLPGVSKADLRNVENAAFSLQPLMEYQYTGVVFTQENGREWSIIACIENQVNGLGIKVAKDYTTKDALKRALPSIFQDPEVFYGRTIIDSNFLDNLQFPDIVPSILKWMCKGESYLDLMEAGKKETFINLCKTQYDFEPDFKNIKAIAEKLGSQKNAWIYVWQMYAAAPHKYPEIEEVLRLAKPEDLGTGIFSLPEETWPQVNEQQEEILGKGMMKAAKSDEKEALSRLMELEKNHAKRRSWVWYELGKAPLTDALQYLVQMAAKSIEVYPSGSINELITYYTSKGFLVDQFMRKSLASVKSDKDKKLVKSIIKLFYTPWLESITNKFQKLIASDYSLYHANTSNLETESYILFVDAFRYELAQEFHQRLLNNKWKATLNSTFAAIPTLTPTSKPNVSPIADLVLPESNINEFRPVLVNGKDLQTAAFREALNEKGYKYVSGADDVHSEGKYWQEIGEIDTKGHEEQSEMVKRIEELFFQVNEALDLAFEKGIHRVKIVTDHGWLLLPDGLPKTQIYAGLTETLWGRCALIKEGAVVDLLQLPWRWNPSIYIAYAPGISFFKANQEYAHGGISVHECLVPVMLVENPIADKFKATINVARWVNLKCTIETSEVPEGYSIDIRTKYNDSKTSIVLSKSKTIVNQLVTLMVDDGAESQASTIVLLDENERIMDKKPTTVGG